MYYRPMNLLEVKNLKVHFPVKHGLFSRVQAHVKAVDDVSFTIQPGETLGLVGESGCGKSTTGRLALGLIEPDLGSVAFDGEAMPAPGTAAWRALRARAQLVFQDPLGATAMQVMNL